MAKKHGPTSRLPEEMMRTPLVAGRSKEIVGNVKMNPKAGRQGSRR